MTRGGSLSDEFMTSGPDGPAHHPAANPSRLLLIAPHSSPNAHMTYATPPSPRGSVPVWNHRRSPRADHSAAVLFRVYAKRLDGAAATANARIEAALRNGG